MYDNINNPTIGYILFHQPLWMLFNKHCDDST